jgi:hypothetical protein
VSDAEAGGGEIGLTADEVMSGIWLFAHAQSPDNARAMMFKPDESIAPAAHPNEARWRIEDGALILVSRDGHPSSRYRAVRGEQGIEHLSGNYLLDPGAAIKFILRRAHWGQHRKVSNGTRLLLDRQIRDRGWRIGDHSYGVPQILDERWADLHIGKFTSIASGVSVALGNHRMDTVST